MWRTFRWYDQNGTGLTEGNRMKLNHFNFRPFNGQVLLTNDFGEFCFLRHEDFNDLIHSQIDTESPIGQELLRKHMIYTESNLKYSFSRSGQLRDYKDYLNAATSLHIFVVTTACNLRCVYCQANNGVSQPHVFMTKETASKAVDIALQSPARFMTFEFQGGEPLLNYDVIRHIIEYAETKNTKHEIRYNVVTNLTLLTDEMLSFFKEHNVGISTSIDGSKDIHDRNRPFPDGSGSFAKVKNVIDRIHNAGMHIGAIETTTRQTLPHAASVLETYRSLGFDSIFVRPLTPLGKALQSWDLIGYSPEEFIEFYSEILRGVIEINRAGTYFKEEHATILMNKILGDSVNYMELRSPCGAGIGQLAYFADGNVFTCDEGRMVYEMGNDAFLLGNVNDHNLSQLIENSTCKAVCASSILETIPSCCDCVYQPYCGTCPVVNYVLQGDVIEKHPREYKCLVYSGIFDEVFSVLQTEDKEKISILESWCN